MQLLIQASSQSGNFLLSGIFVFLLVSRLRWSGLVRNLKVVEILPFDFIFFPWRRPIHLSGLVSTVSDRSLKPIYDLSCIDVINVWVFPLLNLTFDSLSCCGKSEEVVQVSAVRRMCTWSKQNHWKPHYTYVLDWPLVWTGYEIVIAVTNQW